MGHLVAAVNAKFSADIDLLHFVVANVPWQKEGSRALTEASIRYNLVARALEGLDGLVASDIEIRRGGPSFTYDTLATLHERNPDDTLVLVVGADAAITMHTWERSSDLADLAELVVVSRPGFRSPSSILGWATWTEVEIPSLDISSTDLRQRAKDGRPLEFLLPRFAIEFIKENGLYS